jgi:prefoldin subunit 5
MLPDKWSQLKLPSIGKPDPAEQERLLKLFWNRAELKKELQGLDDQLHNLRNKLKQQENANSRLQQQLEQLEMLLGNPERGFDALVHFGLKALWRACRDQLDRFASDLKRDRQDAQRKQQLAEFQQDRSERLKVADERLRQAQEVADAERERLRQRDERMARLKGFWNYFKRRDLAAEILAQRQRCVVAERQLADMRESRRSRGRNSRDSRSRAGGRSIWRSSPMHSSCMQSSRSRASRWTRDWRTTAASRPPSTAASTPA